MSESLKFSPEVVEQVATTIESLNTQLTQKLEESRVAVHRLTQTWQGEAATATQVAFDSFAKKYFENYSHIIRDYVLFLKENVHAGYAEVEIANIELADVYR